jgi:hypothetical protein
MRVRPCGRHLSLISFCCQGNVDRLLFAHTKANEADCEVPPKFRLPWVTYHRSHHEREDDEGTEAGIHHRVQGIGSEASQSWADSRSGGQGVGVGRTHVTELGQGGRDRDAQWCGSQGGDTGADGAVTTARRKRATEARERNPKKTTAYFARDMR